MVKTVRIYEETYEDLKNMAKYGDSMAELVRKCVEAYKRRR
jgi:predicted CopG family antitoxin